VKAVFRHELDSYRNGVIAFVFGAFLLLFAGIYTMAYNIKYGITNFEYVVKNMSFVFMIIVPILTMRVLAEEKRQKTDQLLYSLPLTMTKVVLGKFGAMLCVFLVPFAIICLYPLALTAFGNVYLPAAYSALFGFFLLGAALLSIGMFISSLTESQGVAAGIGFIVVVLNYFLSSLASLLSDTAFTSFAALLIVGAVISVLVQYMTKNSLVAAITALLLCGGTIVWYVCNGSAFEGLLKSVIGELSLFERFYGMVNGVFDLTTIVYFLTVTFLFVFLSVQSMEKRRWSE